jgi:hypothetical protein
MGAIRRDGQVRELDGIKETDNRKHIKKVEGKGTNKEKRDKIIKETGDRGENKRREKEEEKVVWSICCSTFGYVMPCSLADGQNVSEEPASSSIRYNPTFINTDISKTLINIYQVTRCHQRALIFKDMANKTSRLIYCLFIYLTVLEWRDNSEK